MEEKVIMSTKTSTRPFGIRDKFGYMMGDVANDFMFIFASGYLMVFYTEVLKVTPALVATLFLVSRIIDAFSDIGMGVIVDTVKPAKDGRFRSWIRRMCIPVTVASFLMYQSSLADASMTVKVVYMFVTYILWGSICYTGINIPYGSMAASISDDAKDRASLSTWRSVGAQLASTVINMAAPVIVYYTNDAGDKVVRDGVFTKLAGVFAICSLVCYFICYKNTVERVQVAPKPKEKGNNNLVKTLFSSRALLALIGAAIFLVFGTILTNSLNPYLYAQFFKNTEALSTYNLLLLFTTLGLAPFIVVLSTKFGKKETAVVGMFFTGIIYIVLCILHVQSVWVYVGITFIGTFGYMYFQMAVWAFLTDVLDDSEVRTHKRDDGAIYGVYSFARKLGQAIAGGLGGFALTAIGYDVTVKGAQAPAVTDKLYTVTTLSQGTAFIIVGLILLFVYPLSKKKIEENGKVLKERRANAN